MARPTIGTLIKIDDETGGVRYIQSRPDTWANTELAADLDAFQGQQQDEVVLWFDRGAEVVSGRRTNG